MSLLRQSVENIQQNDYLSIVIITAVAYDYLLTLSSEIEYIWNRPWTWVSTLFILARYFGLCSAMFYSIWWSSFFPASVKMYVSILQPILIKTFQAIDRNETDVSTCTMIYIVSNWSLWIFVCAADLVMILRIWAIYNRSRVIITTLFIFYVVEITYLLIDYVISSTHSHLNPTIVTAAEVGHISYCMMEDSSSPVWIEALYFFQIAFGTVMCLLITIQFVKESLQMFKVTKRFRLNQFMIHIARDGMIYFIVIILFSLINVLALTESVQGGGWQSFLAWGLQEIPPFTLFPRFVVDLRELDVRNRQGGQGSVIDSAFGLGTELRHDDTMSSIMFSGCGQDENREQDDEIQMVERVQEVRRACSRAI